MIANRLAVGGWKVSKLVNRRCWPPGLAYSKRRRGSRTERRARARWSCSAIVRRLGQGTARRRMGGRRMRWNLLHLNLLLVRRHSSRAVMNGIFSQVFAQIGPASTNSHHYSFSTLSNSADKQLSWRCCFSAMKMIDPDGTLLTCIRSRTPSPVIRRGEI